MDSNKNRSNKKSKRLDAPWWDETCAELVRKRSEALRNFRKNGTMENFDIALQLYKETKQKLRKIKREKLMALEKEKLNKDKDPKEVEDTTQALNNNTIAKKTDDADSVIEVVEAAGKVTLEDDNSQNPQTKESQVLQDQSDSTDTQISDDSCSEKMIQCQITRSDEIKISKIYYSFNNSPFGRCLIGVIENNDTEKAICYLSFSEDTTDEAISHLKMKFPSAHLIEENEETKKLIKTIFYSDNNTKANLTVVPIVLKGTAFQMKVWETLTKIPVGTLVTYKEVAEMINSPSAARAVGGAVKANNVGFLIPCHRVVNKNGCNKFSWGTDKKVKMQEFEKQIIS